MARWNVVRGVFGVVVSVLLLSGCALEAPPDDGVSWVREGDEALDWGLARRPESIFSATAPKDVDEPAGDEAEAEDEARPTIEPMNPEQEIKPIIREEDEQPSEDLVKDDPIRRWDPQPEPRTPAKGL